MTERRGLGRAMTVVGLLCIAGTLAVIRELITLLPEMPADWWSPPTASSRETSQFDLRAMVVDLSGLAWLGSWLYGISFIWLVVVAWRFFRRRVALVPRDRVLVAVQVVLLLVVLGLTHLTPLKYPWFHGTPL